MNSHELWQVEVDGRVYAACMDEVIEWIHEGAILPTDRIRRGSLRWLPADRVPELDDHFQRAASPQREHFSEALDSDVEPLGEKAAAVHNGKAKSTVKGFCSKHRSLRAAYVCATCGESYCSDCCNRFGNVKLCPECGTMCLPYTKADELDQIHGALNRPYARKIGNSASTSRSDSRLTFLEILDSVRWPFKRPSLFGGLMVVSALSSVAAATAVTAEFTFLAISAVAVLALTALLHSVTALAFAEIRDSARRSDPLRQAADSVGNAAASIGVSFGPFILLVSAAMIFAWFQFSSSVYLAESQMISTQNEVTRFVSEKNQSSPNKPRISASIEARREGVVNSFFGASSGNASILTVAQSLMRLSVIYLLPIGAAFLFGISLFPAACVNSISSESFVDRWNPVRALRLVRVAGFEYVKILLIAIIFTLLATTTAALVEQAIELTGSTAAAAVACIGVLGALFAYFWTIFSRLMALVFVEAELNVASHPMDFHEITQIQ